MTDKGVEQGEPPPSSRWREASERLRSNARVFVVSLGAVAVTVVAGLSLTGLSEIDPDSPNYPIAISAAIVATLGVVAMLALALRLSAASAVSLAELLSLQDGAAARGVVRWRRVLRPGQEFARKVVNEKANGYIAGYDDLKQFSDAVSAAHLDQRNKAMDAANAPDDESSFRVYEAARRKSAWYNQRVRALVEVASFQRLRWNFGFTSALMAVAGAATAVGIVTYAANLQPSTVPDTPIAVATHQRITVEVPDTQDALGLYQQVLGCSISVYGLVTTVDGAEVSVITIPKRTCRSVTLTVKWDGTAFVPDFGISASTEPQPTPTP